MEFKKTLLASSLLSALALTGCGGGGGGGGGGAETGGDPAPGAPAPGAPAPGTPAPNEPAGFGFIDEHSTKISGDIQAAVKAATFFKYEEDVANYVLAFDYVADYSGQLGDFLSENAIYLAIYKTELASDDGKPIEGNCTAGGTLVAQGYVPGLFDANKVTDLDFNAAQYCTVLEGTEAAPDLAGDEVTLTGDMHLVIDNPGYSLGLTETVIQYNEFEEGIADASVAITGTVDYSETNSGSQLAINAAVTFDGIAGNYNFTQACESLVCLINAEVIPGDGNTYTVAGLNIALSNGYQGSADISYSAALGELAVSFDQVQYCVDGSIATGTMNIAEKDGIAEIQTTFNGCGEDPLVEFYADGAP
ncbi:hypothetical protein A9R00_00740 [Oleispira antarctica]|uniref:Uncharacterized protein n=1 Tax=Oleispira antarctica TaxID=188908 RepID=A0A1Y5HW08_OLEAN|nr:hypothetical protein A9R00_00740 [Oleispira antarctica]